MLYAAFFLTLRPEGFEGFHLRTADQIWGSTQVLGGIADTVAQSLTAIRTKSRRSLPVGGDISDGIEMPEYNEKSFAKDFMAPNKKLPPPFDFERLTRFMSFGFIMSPAQFHWFAFLSRAFPITKESATIPAMKRVAFDQLIFAPIGTLHFRSN